MNLLGRFKSVVGQTSIDEESNMVEIDHGDEDAEEGDIRWVFEYDEHFDEWRLRSEVYQPVAKGPDSIVYRWHSGGSSKAFNDREDAIEFADWLSENARAMSEDTDKAILEE